MKVEAPGPLWGLRRFPVLADLPDAPLHALAGASVSRQVSRGTILHVPGERADEVYCLHGGRVSSLWEHGESRTISIGDFGPGDIFGESCLWMAAGANWDDTAVTTSPALLTIVPRIVFRRLLDEHPAVERAVVAQSVAHQDATRRRLCDALSLSLRARVVGQLLRLAEAGRDTPQGRKFTIMRQRELAALVVCTRESAALALRALEDERLIVRAGRELIVPDLDRLRAAAHERPSQASNVLPFSRLPSPSRAASAP
ncbi:cAMP-binding domain of CRP or a regulatory subunit of cAMP-dependent protein kinases [Nannocystis exedens]|uniref:cAMP-binding domain of CRP or a regulatory subunit of cAMP-dependent protein kinases n=1 Tax=Nannocystis exedens TaxID=54 RepID=A0A1I2I695_9BACT|nr:Crp/Fnr family transcriptional regulator [Nannocystis exedens]PCC74641.1 cAMP-activated global transcriptional regulator CRP [Nannocystis exedens]SFF37130.1 cAMP-binding domain of CRP or a regulatory subunit of cAMP-dependent protein kinases [Nannocystis exedens]